MSRGWTSELAAKYAIRRTAVGAVESPKHTKPASALVRHAPPKQSGKVGLGIVVTIIGLRHRPLDSDNFISGAKPLRDAIAESLGIDDGSERIRFEYAQAHTTGEQGTIVKIELLKGIE